MLAIRLLDADDPPVIAVAFNAIGWDKPFEQYRRYLQEQAAGDRTVLVARLDGDFAGYVTIVWSSAYAALRDAGIPEISDFNVLPQYRRRGIGTALMGAAEALVSERSAKAGIGVGLYPDYGPAQQLYVLRGYVPDGRGVVWRNRNAAPGESVVVDDDLALYFTRKLR